MSGRECARLLNLPEYVPALVSFFIFGLATVISLACYIRDEHQLRKRYQRLCEMDAHEKAQEEAEFMGNYTGEIKIVRSIEHVGRKGPSIHTLTPNSYRVMMERRRPTSKPSHLLRPQVFAAQPKTVTPAPSEAQTAINFTPRVTTAIQAVKTGSKKPLSQPVAPSVKVFSRRESSNVHVPGVRSEATQSSENANE